MDKQLIFITGGARSGKSRLAEQLAEQLGSWVLYIATGEPGDAEMVERIRCHRERRPAHWQTLEAPRDVVPALRMAMGKVDVVLLDCVSLWVSNLLLTYKLGVEELQTAVATSAAVATADAVTELLSCFREGAATFVIVSNEVGSGVVPPTSLGRLYRDILGTVNQLVASAADIVYYCVAGRVIDLSEAPTVGQFITTDVITRSRSSSAHLLPSGEGRAKPNNPSEETHAQ